uniref:Cytochrome c oxidase subunit 7C, mitochondrial n=1 Tax=Gasterosteus aculeatus aculeatus TaxID=481459 RepID=A0AAQ4PD30_GASAC
MSFSFGLISHNPLRTSYSYRKKKVAYSNVIPEHRNNQTLIMLGQAVRRFTTSAVRSSHYAEGPGKNLPFSVENKWRLLGMMVVFFGSGFAFPFIVVRHQILKK